MARFLNLYAIEREFSTLRIIVRESRASHRRNRVQRENFENSCNHPRSQPS
ncbi:hypothetical protein CKA32_006340 [Geitlerinema sp. FC II]|nr:hypothetical protein CKA32_006340 [Geitlerinema sp. FC II]